jgi:hypothetical protein
MKGIDVGRRVRAAQPRASFDVLPGKFRKHRCLETRIAPHRMGVCLRIGHLSGIFNAVFPAIPPDHVAPSGIQELPVTVCGRDRHGSIELPHRVSCRVARNRTHIGVKSRLEAGDLHHDSDIDSGFPRRFDQSRPCNPPTGIDLIIHDLLLVMFPGIYVRYAGSFAPRKRIA